MIDLTTNDKIIDLIINKIEDTKTFLDNKIDMSMDNIETKLENTNSKINVLDQKIECYINEKNVSKRSNCVSEISKNVIEMPNTVTKSENSENLNFQEKKNTESNIKKITVIGTVITATIAAVATAIIQVYQAISK